MINRLLVAAGTVATVAGIIFALQGFGVLGGSVMTGSSVWAALGPIIAAAGLLAVAVGVRRQRSSGSTRS
jgi:hypothetical protein